MVRQQGWYVLRMVMPWMVLFALIPVVISHAAGSVRFLHARPALVGPKPYYLALGDSLAFGYQPDLDWVEGYANDFARDLSTRGMRQYVNFGCPSESTATMISGGCPLEFLHKSLYLGSQLRAAVNYLRAHAGQVSPVTLDIGVNDLVGDLDAVHCTVSPRWLKDLALVENNLKNVIIPQLLAALTVNGQVTGDLILLNYYDPYQDKCPNTVANIQTLNQGLASAVAGSATMVDVFSAFAAPARAQTAPPAPPATSTLTPLPTPLAPAGARSMPVTAPVITTPASNVCAYTWMCSSLKDIHPTVAGYAVMASSIENTVHY